MTTDNSLYHIQPDSDAVIVLGFPDSGKDVLIQILTNHDDKLNSIESSQNPKTYTIHSDLVSNPSDRKIYPISTKDSNKTMSFYWEFPDYFLPQDVENSKDEVFVRLDIISRFFESKVMEKTGRLKLVYALNYHSVVSGDDEATLTLQNMIKTYDKYNDSIALVLTDVNYHDNENVTNALQKILKKMEVDEKYNETKVLFEKKFLVDKCPLIGILKQPTEQGSLRDISSFRSEKESLMKLISENIAYSKLNKSDDFLNNLQLRSLKKVNKLIYPIEQDLGFFIDKFFDEIIKYFESVNEASNDIFKLHDLFSKAVSKFNSFNAESKDSVVLIDLILLEMKKLNASISNEPAKYLQKYSQVYQFFKAVLKSNNVNIHLNLQQKRLNDTINYLKDFENGFSILIEVFNLNHDIVKKNCQDLDFKNYWFENNALLEAAKFVYQKTKDEFSFKIYKKLSTSPARKTLEEKLKLILNYILAETSYDKSISKGLIVRGNYVFLSELPSTNRTVEIYAREKFYVDSDYSARSQISVVAPLWIVTGDYRINFHGMDGQRIESRAREGENGISGQSGGPGGNFFGLTDEIINGSRLTIFSRGGDGGSGQDGGFGINGKDTYAEDMLNWRAQTIYQMFPSECDCGYKSTWACTECWDCICTIIRRCNDGGQGKSGGSPGLPGTGGNSTILTLTEPNNRKNIINTYSSWGKYGDSGRPGSGGRPSIPGFYWQFFYREYWLPKYQTADNIKFEKTYCRYGQPGPPSQTQPPLVPLDTKDLKRNVTFDPPIWKIVNEFKIHDRNESTGVRDSFLRDFIKKIDGNSKVSNLTDDPALAFTTEFLDLEKQFNPKEPELFLEYYNSLRNRIDRHVHVEPLVGDKKIVFDFLGAALMSKIRRITLRPDDDLIIDLEKELNTTIRYIERYDNQQYQLASQETFEKYNKSFNDKIKEVQGYINGEVSEDLNRTYDQIDGEVNELIEEVIQLRDETETEKKNLEAQQSKLGNQLVFKKILSGAKFIGGGLALFGPIGKIAGATVAGVAGVLENIVSDDNTPDIIAKLPPAVSAAVTDIKAAYENKKKALNDNLELTKEKLKEIEGTKEETNLAVKNTLKDLQNRIKNTQKELSQLEHTGKKTSWENILGNHIDEKHKELVRYYDEKIKLLDQKSNDAKPIKVVKMIKKTLSLINFVNSGITAYEAVKNGEAALDKLSEAVKMKQNDIEKLNIYEAEVRGNFKQMITRMRETLDSRKKSLNGKSAGFLDVSRWRVQESIQELKIKVEEWTKGFPVGNSLKESIDKLGRGMGITIDLYDRIEKYRDEVARAEFFKGMMHTTQSEFENIVNEELRDKVGELKLTALSNVIRKRYDSDLNAFRMYVFPLAKYYFSDFDPIEQNFNNVKDYTLQAEGKIESMKFMLSDYDSHITKFDDSVHAKVTFDNPLVGDEPPFYRWEYDSLARYLPDLLSGNEVTLFADVNRALPSQDAIKFNVIDVRLRLTWASDQKKKEFNDSFVQYSVTATHFGDSRYKCCGKIYSMSSPRQPLTFSIRNDGTKNHNPSVAYEKLKNHAALLSPYATWSFKLIPPSTTSLDFKPLTDFEDFPMELELTGHGYYVDKNSTYVCSSGLLDRFYRTVD